MDFSPRVQRANGRYPSRAVAGIEYQIASPIATVASTTFATPGGASVSSSGQLVVLRRSAQLLALLLAIDHWTDARIVDMTPAWLDARVSVVPLGSGWLVTCEVCEDNRVVASAIPDVPASVADQKAETASAYGCAIAHAVRALGAADVRALASIA